MIRYITNFHTTIEWYMDCGFFSDSFTVKKTMKDGELDKYYFYVNKEKAEGQFSVMEKDLRTYLGDTPLRDLTGTKANLIWRLNHGYALSISEKGSINQGVLVLGMSNFLSNYAVKQIEAMTKHLNPSTGQTPLKVYTVGSEKSIVDQVKQGESRKGLLKNNLFLKWDSSCLLAKMYRKFDKVKFNTIYLDHNATPNMRATQKAALKELYDVTIPLLRESKLLNDDCKIVLPFNVTTVYYLHKSWDKVKKYANVSFLSELKDNPWYESTPEGVLRDIEKKDSTRMELPDQDQLNVSSVFFTTGLCNLISMEAEKIEGAKKKKRKKTSSVATQSPLNLELGKTSKALEKWRQYTNAQFDKLKWIQLEISDVKIGAFTWPDHGTKSTEAATVQHPDIELICNMDQVDFNQKTKDGECPDISIVFSDGTFTRVAQIKTDDFDKTVIIANTNRSNNKGPIFDDDDDDNSCKSSNNKTP